jgi:uncharacterized protein
MPPGLRRSESRERYSGMEEKRDGIPVRHNEAESRFEAEIDGRIAVADYQLRGGEMIMTHTFVPLELRGRGIAERLVRTALAHAQAQHLRIVPACSYVELFIQRHREFQSLVS